MSELICAIHQPNFFPWMGYFDKIRQSNIFVFLDDVQLQKTGSSWTNRVQLNHHGQARWFTCPIQRPVGIQKIRDVQFVNLDWKNKLILILKQNYKGYPNYANTLKIIEKILDKTETNLISEFNIISVLELCDIFKIKTTILKQSELNVSGKSTELLINLVKKTNCNIYLSGAGSSGYQEDELFSKEGLQLKYQNFKPIPYGNSEKFIPGLSIIDYMMSTHNV